MIEAAGNGHDRYGLLLKVLLNVIKLDWRMSQRSPQFPSTYHLLVFSDSWVS